MLLQYKCATQQKLNSDTGAGYQKRLFFLLFSYRFERGPLRENLREHLIHK